VDIASLPPDQIATLVARILGDSDPASVGLRRIIRKKTAESRDFPLRAFTVEDFAATGKSGAVLSDDERRIIELEQLLAAQKKLAQEQKEQARAAVARAYEKGLNDGISKGYAQGRETAAREFDEKIAALQERISTMLQELESEKNGLYARADSTLLMLCRLMAKKIIGSECGTRSEVILAVLRKALSYVADKDRLVVRVAPADFSAVSDKREFWAPVAERLTGISIEQDERIARGGCILESASGVVDARLDTQVAELGDVIDKAWEAVHSLKNSPEADNG
jgi:flagellar biosynthesis/type III secretory pathway protein FliH